MSGWTYPFSAIVGQARMRLAHLLLAIDGQIGGVLVTGEKGTAKSTIARSLARHLPVGTMRTLALGATEDRIVGGLDVEATLRTGQPTFADGLLTQIDGGVLYIDEVNLLDDHLADLVLDAAASGVVHCEREGFSLTRPTRFALIGTMNPEEGELRPQLRDRFGMCVRVSGATEVAERVEIMQRQLDFDADPDTFCAQWAQAEAALARRLHRAQAGLAQVHISPDIRQAAAEICRQAQTMGHRADLALVRAARAHAAWHGRPRVEQSDLDAVADLVLCHRRPKEQPGARSPEPTHPPEPDMPSATDSPEFPAPAQDPQHRHAPPEREVEPGQPYRIRPIGAAQRRAAISGHGRRRTAGRTDRRGRYRTARPTTQAVDLALDATVRAAAVHQVARRARHAQMPAKPELAIYIERGDWHRKVRTRRSSSCVLLVVDASGSMGARGRMIASKAAVLSLLLDAYVKREKVALIAFRRFGAQVLVPATSSITLAQHLLRDLAIGGQTPLAAGLAAADQMVSTLVRKDRQVRPLVIVITDGRGNVGLAGTPSRQAPAQAVGLARQLARRALADWVVIDPNPTRSTTMRPAAALAAALGAHYLTVSELRASTLVDVARSDRQTFSRKDQL